MSVADSMSYSDFSQLIQDSLEEIKPPTYAAQNHTLDYWQQKLTDAVDDAVADQDEENEAEEEEEEEEEETPSESLSDEQGKIEGE